MDPSYLKFKNVNLQSTKFIMVREEGANSVAVVDTTGKNVTRYPAKDIDSAIVHPISKVIGFRAGPHLQIFNLEMKTRVKATQMNETVAFWSWVDTKTIAIVGESNVYHWSMDASDEPELKFPRASSSSPVQVLDYRVSSDGQWLASVGITSGARGLQGVLQLHSVARGKSQATLDSTACCFADITLDGRSEQSTLFCFVNNTPEGTKLSMIELSPSKEFKTTADIDLTLDNDFILKMHADPKSGCLVLFSKNGFLFIYEIQSAKCVFAKRVSQSVLFATAQQDSSVMTVDQAGRAIALSVDTDNIVSYVTQQLSDPRLGILMATRYNLPGADDIFKQQFVQLVGAGNTAQAVKVAAEAPNGVLRTQETVAALHSLQGTPPPVLQYYSALLKKGPLKDFESVGLVQLVIASGAPAAQKHIKDWIAEDKLAYSEALGDALRRFDMKLACGVYLRCTAPEKAIGCLLLLGEFQKILDYSASVNFTPDFGLLLQQLHQHNKDNARDFAVLLSGRGLVDVNMVVELFMRANDVSNTTSFLLDYLKDRGDNPEDAELQTRLIEINIMHSPQVAEAIMESEEYSFTQFDRLRIAQMCERMQLYQQALLFYDDVESIKRVMLIGLNQNLVSTDFILNFFGEQTEETCLECLRDLLRFNLQQHLRLVVEVAKRYSESIGPAKLIDLFNEFDADSGIYYYLGSFVNFTQDASLIMVYIKAALKIGHMKEVERVCRENEFYDPYEVKEFLLQSNLKDPRPLIYVCDRNDFVDELTKYLYNNNMFAFIEAYAGKMNQGAVPQVVGSLLDLNCDDDRIRAIINSVRPPACPVKELVEQVVTRGRLRLLASWLEARRHEGSEDADLHNALAMVYVDNGMNPQHFLMTNPFYESLVVGKFCETRDPYLAFIAYRRAKGACDVQLLEVSNKNGFFKDQAKYLVERQDAELWKMALDPSSEHRRSLIDQVVASALPESRVDDEVANTVKAFMEAGLPNELIELLERIVLHGSADSEFTRNKNLQNLLILTAVKADPSRVMDYLSRLTNYDGPEIARLAASEEYKLYEEALFIYKKEKMGPEAIGVLLNELEDLDRATEFAGIWDAPEVWSLLGRAQMGKEGMVREAIASFLKAEDASAYPQVILAANRDNYFTELIPYLSMARVSTRDSTIDNELLYAHAKTEDMAALEEFLNSPNSCKVEVIGDRVFTEELYEAARLMFDWVKNYGKLALCYVALQQFQHAVDAARKASAVVTWKAVCYACVDAGEFRLAQACGVHIIVVLDQLLDLIAHYEAGCFFEQLIALLEQGLHLDRAHQGIFTQLGVCYAKYREDKLMEHIRLFNNRVNVSQLLSVCKANGHWKETVFLLQHYDQFENAVDVMIAHSPVCWDHEHFKQLLTAVPNNEVYYRALTFYLSENPFLLSDLLVELSAKLDHARVVSMVKRSGNLPIIKKYLISVQRENNAVVNEALNTLYVEEEDHAALSDSIKNYDAFDQLELAVRVEKHGLLEFRRIAAVIYKQAGRWESSIALSKSDNMFADVVATAAESKDAAIAEGVLRYFVDKKEHACFAATLYSCYAVIPADIAIELAWKNNLTEVVMPFMLQTFREYNDRLGALEARFAAQDAAAKKAEEQDKVAAEEQAQKAAAYVGIPSMGNARK